MSTRNRPFLRGWADGSAWMTRKNELSNAQSEWHSTIRLACANRFHVCVFNNDADRLVHVSAMPAGLLQADVPEAGGVNLFLRSPSDTGRLGLLARTDCTCVCSATAHLDWWCSSTIGRQSTAAVGWTGVPNDSGKTERFASWRPIRAVSGHGRGGSYIGSVWLSSDGCPFCLDRPGILKTLKSGHALSSFLYLSPSVTAVQLSRQTRLFENPEERPCPITLPLRESI